MGTKTRATGADAQQLAAFETVYGTPPNGGAGGVYTKLSFKEHSLGAERPLGEDPLLGQGRDAQDPFYEAINVAGSIGVPIDLRASGFWLKGVLGDPVTTDNLDGTWDHVFTSGGELPSLTLETGHMQLATKRFFQHAGGKCGSYGFAMARSGRASANIDLIAQGETNPVAAVDATPLSYVLQMFSQGTGSIKMGGVQLASVTGGRFGFSNGLEGIETIRADGKIDGVDEGEAKAEGSVDIRFGTDTTITDAVAAETPVSMDYIYSIPGAEGYALTFAMPRVFLPKKKQSITTPAGIEASYDWQAAYDDTAGHMLEVTLVNDVAAY